MKSRSKFKEGMEVITKCVVQHPGWEDLPMGTRAEVLLVNKNAQLCMVKVGTGRIWSLRNWQIAPAPKVDATTELQANETNTEITESNLA